MKKYKIDQLSIFAQKRAFKDWESYMTDIPFIPLNQETFESSCEDMGIFFTEHGNVIVPENIF